MALYREGKAAMAADGTVTGTGTNWQSSLSLIRPGATIMFLSSPIQMAVVNKVVSDTEIKAITTNGAVVASTDYSILLSDSLTVDGLAQDVAETLRYYQSQETVIAEAVDFFKDFDFEALQNLANQIKADSETAESSASAAAASESAAKTSENNSKASEVAAEAARDQVQQIINDAGEQSTLVVLAKPSGAGNIGKLGGGTLQEGIDSRVKVVSTPEDIDNSSENVSVISVADISDGGAFRLAGDSAFIPEAFLTNENVFKTDANGNVWIRDFSNGVDPEWFGAVSSYIKTDGTIVEPDVDNALAFAKAIAFCNSYANYEASLSVVVRPKFPLIVCKPNRAYSFSTTLEWDASVQLIGNGVMLYATEGFNSSASTISAFKAVIRYYNKNTNRQFGRVFENVEIAGVGLGKSINDTVNIGVIGLKHEGILGSERTTCNIEMMSCHIRDCAIGEYFGNRCYLTQHINCAYTRNLCHWFAPQGTDDAGENHSFLRCTIGNSGCIILQAGDFNLINCSLDYLTTTAAIPVLNTNSRAECCVLVDTVAVMRMIGGHTEIDSTIAFPRFNTSSSGKIYFDKVRVHTTENTNPSANCYFYQSGYQTMISLDGVLFDNGYGFQYLVNGNGRFNAKNCRGTTPSLFINGCNIDHPANVMRVVNTASINPKSIVSSRGSTALDRTNIAVTQVANTDSDFVSPYVLQITKSAATSSGQIALLLPVKGNIPFLALKIKSSTAASISTGLAYAACQHFDADGYSVLTGIKQAKVNNTSLTANTVLNWTIRGNEGDLGPTTGSQEPVIEMDDGLQFAYFSIDMSIMPVGATLIVGDFNMLWM